MTKTISIPRVASLNALDFKKLELFLEEHGSKAAIACVNWKEDFPYMPDCTVTAAHDGESIALLYHVRGLDLRAVETEDNGRIWEDSCVEFFVEDPLGRKYYNFELSCAGKLLASEGPDRHDRTRADERLLSRIRRFCSIKEQAPYEIYGEVHSWSAGMIIPLDAIGASGAELLHGNFYKCADKTPHTHFVSWSPIGTLKPDFHRPEFFGDIILQ